MTKFSNTEQEKQNTKVVHFSALPPWAISTSSSSSTTTSSTSRRSIVATTSTSRRSIVATATAATTASIFIIASSFGAPPSDLPE
uniref:Uncharacterized protein n=1 Tax=Ditylenchus dipsaci TaxID=166011 RepID=A0A915DT26_9BILA